MSGDGHSGTESAAGGASHRQEHRETSVVGRGSLDRAHRSCDAESRFSVEQRLLILDSWLRSKLPAGDFAPLVGVSLHTLRAWKARFAEVGPAGLEEAAGRPTTGTGGRWSRRASILRRRPLTSSAARMAVTGRRRGAAGPRGPCGVVRGRDRDAVGRQPARKCCWRAYSRTGPGCLIVDEPTRGVDVASKAAIHATLERLAAGGTVILLISSELEEVRPPVVARAGAARWRDHRGAWPATPRLRSGS